MDTRTREIYPTKEAARAAGVPDEHLRQIVVVGSGPFKGRRYEVNDDGSRGQRVAVVNGRAVRWRKGLKEDK